MSGNVIIDDVKLWQLYDGPEYADDIGVKRDVIEKAYGRAPRPHAVSDIAPLPTPDLMVELLRDAWLRRWWTGTLDDPYVGEADAGLKRQVKTAHRPEGSPRGRGSTAACP